MNSTVDRPVLLKRGLSATIDEWLSGAEYIRAWIKTSAHPEWVWRMASR